LVDRPQCKKSEKVLKELENIDDEADQKGIGFVKINDDDLAEEYSLSSLPTLVYYRNGIPIIYEGILKYSALCFSTVHNNLPFKQIKNKLDSFIL
jgi:hypothetical protein